MKCTFSHNFGYFSKVESLDVIYVRSSAEMERLRYFTLSDYCMWILLNLSLSHSFS